MEKLKSYVVELKTEMTKEIEDELIAKGNIITYKDIVLPEMVFIQTSDIQSVLELPYVDSVERQVLLNLCR